MEPVCSPRGFFFRVGDFVDGCGFPGGARLGETASPLWNKVLQVSLFVTGVSSDAGDGPVRLGCSGACGRLWPWPSVVAATPARMGPCVWYRVGGKRRLDLCVFSSDGRRWRIQGPGSTGRFPGRHATEKKIMSSIGCSFGSQSSWSAMVFPRNQGRSGWRSRREWIEEVDGHNMGFIEFSSLDLFYEVPQKKKSQLLRVKKKVSTAQDGEARKQGKQPTPLSRFGLTGRARRPPSPSPPPSSPNPQPRLCS